jgi:hypothetical protein
MFLVLLGFGLGVLSTWGILGMKTTGKGWLGKQVFLLQARLDKRREER